MSRFSTYHLYAVVTFLSAFLLFQVQPLISKHILPWFGGGSMVWITALFFFMLVLLLGYVYVLLLSQLTLQLQKIGHSLVLASVTGLLMFNNSQWVSSITPTFQDGFVSNGPVVGVLYVLFLSIGAPFFILATTSSLLQLWYGQSTGKEPFSLYAISNVGSLLGLLSYPFLIEPYLATTAQGQLWTTLFIIYFLGMVAIILQARSLKEAKIAVASVEEVALIRQPVTPVNFLQWVAVASIPVMVMLSSTGYVSGFVAAMPFIWIVPLALYLISFIVSFRGGERSIGTFTLVSVVLVSLAALSLTQVSNVVTVPILLIVLWGAVFAISHYCHEWLYEHRPQAAVLPWFYVALSLGGVFGSALILASTLFILKSAQEFVFVVIATILVALYQLYKLEPTKLLIRRAQLHYLSAISLLLIVSFTFVHVSKASSTLALERNFFGTKRVIETTSDGNRVRALLHELTAHGFEYMDNEEFNRQPIAYYTENSGMGRVMNQQKQKKGEEKMEVAVIGLGAGLLSAFCRPQDHYTFFEIDPEVVAIANKYFTYLERCENKEVILGDARQLMLEEYKAGAKKYDFIIMDAYADDAAPAHLMTAEAVGLYLSLLNPGGVIAIHVSSRYLDLLPVVSGLARAHDLAGRYYHDEEPPEYGTASIWTMLAREENVFAGPELEVLSNLSEIKPVYWTDTKNALLPIVRYIR